MHLGDSRQNIGLAVGGGVVGVLPGTLSKDNTFKRDFRKKKFFLMCSPESKVGMLFIFG